MSISVTGALTHTGLISRSESEHNLTISMRPVARVTMKMARRMLPMYGASIFIIAPELVWRAAICVLWIVYTVEELAVVVNLISDLEMPVKDNM